MLQSFSILQQQNVVMAWNIVVPGGTGPIGRTLLPKLAQHDVTVLSRNAFLASAPNRVTETFGYLGARFLNQNPHVRIRDWDGGDLLDIVGKDWLGWQDDTLAQADIVINLVGGYTEQRTMATERLVRESLRVNPNVLHITVSPLEEEISVVSPGMITVIGERLKRCEDMVQTNCQNWKCLRLEFYRVEEACDAICKVVEEWSLAKKQTNELK